MSIKDELILIKGNKELLLAEDVVDWARSHPDSDLYKAPEFCKWDIEKLAHEQLLLAARRIIALNITYEGGERKFVSLSIDRTNRQGGGYRSIDDVVRSQDLMKVLLADALNDLQRMEARYQHIKELKPVWSQAEKVRRRQNGKTKQAKQNLAQPSAA